MLGQPNHPNAKKGEQELVKQGQSDPNVRDRAQKGVNVGGVIVGARNVLADADEEGKPPAKLAPPRSYLPGRGHGPLVEIIASAKSKADGGEMKVLNKEELEKLDLSPELVEEMRAELERMAGEKGWKLEVVEQPGAPPENQREIRGIIDQSGEDGKEASEEEEAAKDGGMPDGSEEQFFKEEL